MLVSSKFKGLKEVKRRGIANKLVIDIKSDKGTDLNVDAKNKVLRIVDGKCKHLLLNRFSVIGNVKLDLFFVNGGMVLDLKKGMVVADLGEGIYAKVTKNTVDYINCDTEKGVLEGLNWLSYEGLLSSAKVIVGHKYNLKLDSDKDVYVHNLAYNLSITEGTRDVSNWWITAKFVNVYTDLGLGEFEFKVLEEVEEVVVNYPPKRKTKAVNTEGVNDAIIDVLVGAEDEEEE